MSVLFARLPQSVAQALYENASHLVSALSHPAQVYSPVGGRRAVDADVALLVSEVRAIANDFGFPGAALLPSSRADFDRRCAECLPRVLDLAWGEASSPAVWSFVALVALPEITRWRFGTANSERWVATDLTRHTWARAWWRGTTFKGRFDLLDFLTESDLNQLLERRTIGGDRHLVIGLADSLRTAEIVPANRRSVIRGAAARMRRRLAFVDARALDDHYLAELCAEVVKEASSPGPNLSSTA